MSPFAFDVDTAVEPVGGTRWRGRVSDRWSIGATPNGGYILALGLAAIRSSLRHPHPLTVTAHYLSPCQPGQVEVDVEVVKQGRSLSTATAQLTQGDRVRLVVLATYGDLSTERGPTLLTARPPHLPPPEECVPWRLFADLSTPPPISELVTFLPSPETATRLRARAGAARLEGWLAFADGRLPDAAALPLLVDAAPPAVFAALETGWVPTLELSVHVRGLPSSRWLRAVIETRALVAGLLEEDCELWDDGGTLVAMSRQLARVLPPA